jgi:hypothetical protein
MAEVHAFTTPVGRLVGGSVSRAREVLDANNKPRLITTGVDIGKPMMEYSFGIAIPKTPGATHWSQEAWGAPIWAMAHASWPNGEAQRPDFSWKITDGDSTIPNKKGRKPCDQEGYKGHWVIWYSGMLAPRYYTLMGVAEATPLADPEIIKNGYYVQVYGNCRSNAPSQSPGIYMNHSMVCLVAYGEEIVSGPDVSAAGFGGAPLPAGASTTPVASFTPPVAPPPAAPAPVATPAPAAVIVPPNPAVMQPPAPPAPPAAPVRQLTEKANGATYEQLIAAGWNDQTLVQHGLMVG